MLLGAVRLPAPRLTGKPYWTDGRVTKSAGDEFGCRRRSQRGAKSHDNTRGALPMTRFLARVADIAYRRRGRMVLAWIAAAIVIIGVGTSLAGEYNADYDTPGSESKAASDLTEQRFAGYSGQEIYVAWKHREGVRRALAREGVGDFLAEAGRVDHVAAPTP